MATSRPYDQANPLQRGLRRFASSGPGSWLFARTMHHVDRPVFRATRGRHTAASLLAGLPVVMLTTTGARSGRASTVPLLGLPTEGGIAVIASNYGQARNPAWYYNLRKQPAAGVSVDGVAQRVRARELEGAERQRVWDQGLAIYPGWTQYERRASHRQITVFLLEPS